ncbi:MAG: UDP-N-acetylmuramoyl-tripeptide--D-alanyl-D-alanine ligase [Acutalibacteraceae bacterium]|jgi:UDP-N-acetylmuramoyl-tripeptide--D-alanyl-D-alanine ligase
MELACRIVMLIAFAVYAAAQAVYYTHMLQLNSYRPERYRRWCLENARRILTGGRLIFPLLGAAWAVAWRLIGLDPVWLFAGAAALALTGAWVNRPRKAKKPLVVTARVKRLFATQIILLLLCGAALWMLPVWIGVLIYAALGWLLFLWVALSNRVNIPAEKAVARWYVNDAGKRLRSMPDLIVIGITGSYGKTSTKNFLHALLSARYNVLMTPESYNTTMGVVRTVRERLKPSHQVFIAEMGAKNPGDIQEICDLVHPRYGMITSIGEQHLETFKTVENIVRTKFELADSLPADGVAFLNADNDLIRSRPVSGKAVTYGVQPGADYVATDIAVDGQGSRFTVTAPNGEQAAFVTRLLGAHNIQNLVGCVAVAHTLGIPLKELVYPVRLLKPVEHRLQLLPNGYIDDAYNSNPAGFRSALDVLGAFDAQRVLVTPGMVELGERQEALNRELGQYAAAKCDWAILVGEKQAPPLRQGLLDGGFSPQRIHVAPTLQEGLAFLATLPSDKKRIVLLENDLPDNF